MSLVFTRKDAARTTSLSPFPICDNQQKSSDIAQQLRGKGRGKPPLVENQYTHDPPGVCT